MKQKRRVAAACFHFLILIAASWVLFGRPFPELGSAGVWFYAGLAMLLLSTALAEPFFARPADALINAVAALLVAVTYSPRAGLVQGASSRTIEIGKTVLAIVSIALAATAAVAIFTKDGKYSRLSASLTRVARVLGSARVVFSVVFLLAAYAAYSNAQHVLAVLFLTWVVVAVVRPGDYLAEINWRPLKNGERVTATVVALSALGRKFGDVSIRQPRGAVPRMTSGP